MSHLGEPHYLPVPGRPALGTRPHGVVLQVHVVHEERHCTLAFRGALVAETQLTVLGVEAMVHMAGDVIFDLSNVDSIDEIGMNALHYLIQSIDRQNGITRFALTPRMRMLSIDRQRR
jgi:anti-anti-sigma regulatory factor